MKRFRLLDFNDHDVLGGSVSIDTVYIRTYPEIADGDKQPNDLEIGESVRAVYRLSSSKGTYKIVRIDDATEGNA
jgi:hypothetical protein